MKFLIVDDDAITRKILIKILRPYGHFETASDGTEALEFVEQALQEEDNYQVILLDIKMPVLDGAQTLKKIREMEKVHQIQGREHSHVIILSAVKDSKTVLKSFTDGCDAYLIKPIKASKVIDALKNCGIKAPI